MRSFVIRLFILLGLFFPALASAATPLNLTIGWNLLGNSSAAVIDVATTFGDATKITTVWKWSKTAGKWAFYAPSMAPSALTTYAQGKGYDVLISIDPKEGFWVNASAVAALAGPVASGVTLVESDLLQGWNLLGSADNKTPPQLNQGLSGSLNAAGKALVTAWAWDTPNTKWKFYAPALEAQGGTVLTDYITGKGYLPFSTALSASDGFWLNIGAPAPAAKLGLMRAMSIGGNWGGNIDSFKSFPNSFIQSPLLSDNVNWVGIKLPIFNASISDPKVQIRYRLTDTNYANMYSFDDTDLINTVTKLKQNGIKVYLSLVLMQPSSDPTLNCNTAQYGVDSHLIGDPSVPNIQNSSAWGYQCIDPTMWWWNPSHPDHTANVATFWSTYTQVAVYYAKLAQQLGVDMFALGEETDRLFVTRSSARFPNNYKNELTQMVSAIRAQYSGFLTYGQQSFIYWPHPEWWGLDSQASSSLFKDLGLDVVGISSAFPLVDLNFPVVLPLRVYSVAELETTWTVAFNNYLVPLQANNPTTPIIFSDIGFVNSVNAPNSGVSQSGDIFIYSDLNGNGIDDGMEQQANLFQALFNVNKNFNYLLRGAVLAWSQIDTDPNIASYYQTHRDIQLHGKPVEQVITNMYANWKMVSP